MDFSDVLALLIVIGIPLIRRGLKWQTRRTPGHYNDLPKRRIESPAPDVGRATHQHKKEAVIKDIKLVEFGKKKQIEETTPESLVREKIRQQPTMIKTTKRKDFSYFLNKKDIKKGVILKEILGLPRCKKRHSILEDINKKCY